MDYSEKLREVLCKNLNRGSAGQSSIFNDINTSKRSRYERIWTALRVGTVASL